MQKMPELKPRQVTSKLTHHSANVDWDWNRADWSLTTEQYVSEPKCLKWLATSSPWPVTLCKHAGTTVLNEGRVVTWIRPTSINCGMGVVFRNQAAVGTSNYNNTYIPNLAPVSSNVNFSRVVNGTPLRVDTKAFGGGFTMPNDTWRKIRVTWWESGGILYVRFEWFDDPDWVNICDEFSDVDNLWSGEAVNRCGLFTAIIAGGAKVVYADDTEVWGP